MSENTSANSLDGANSPPIYTTTSARERLLGRISDATKWNGLPQPIVDYWQVDYYLDLIEAEAIRADNALLAEKVRGLPWHSHTTPSHRDDSQVFVVRADLLRLLEDKAEPE